MKNTDINKSYRSLQIWEASLENVDKQEEEGFWWKTATISRRGGRCSPTAIYNDAPATQGEKAWSTLRKTTEAIFRRSKYSEFQFHIYLQVYIQ